MMSSPEHSGAALRFRPALAAVAIVLVGLSLRSPITSLAAVLPSVQSDLDLSPTLAGVVSSLPVLCFGVGAFIVTRATRRFGINPVVTAGLVALTVFIAIRPFGGPWWLLVTTAAIGLAITAGNVLLPVLVRRDFPHRQGPMLAVATASMTSGGALGAVLTVPLALWVGWRWALAAWALIVFLGVFASRFTGPEDTTPAASKPTGVWKLPGAWMMAIFFGLMSGLFYANTVWQPTFLPSLAGITEAEAGVAASVFQIFGIVGSLVTPIITTRVFHRQAFAMSLTSLWIVYAGGLLLLPSWYFAWMIVGGIVQGGVWAMLLTLFMLRAPEVAMVRDLSGMTQTIGYGISAASPIALGAIFEATETWRSGIFLLLAMAIAITALAPIISSRKKLTTPAG